MAMEIQMKRMKKFWRQKKWFGRGLLALVGLLFLECAGCQTSQPEGAGSANPRSAEEAALMEVSGLDLPETDPVTPEEPTELEENLNQFANPGQVLARMRPGLSIGIAVYVSGAVEFQVESKRIPDEGEIALPLVGVVKVDGLTLGELSGVLTKKYADFFVNPTVIVQFVLETAGGEFTASPWGFVTVLGRVAKQGKVALPPTQDMTVSTAIQRAGGFITSAKDSAIILSRKLPDGRTVKMDVNLRAMGRKGAVEEDIQVVSGDVIFVPEEIF